MKAGGEAYLLAVAWRHAGSDPYRLYHQLDASYRPVGAPDAPATPPAYPNRVKTFIYAAAVFAEEEAIERVRIQAGVGAARKAGMG